MMQVIFFANMARPITQQAFAERLAAWDEVLLIGQAMSIWKSWKIPSLKERCRSHPSFGPLWDYRPIHIPERIPGLRSLLSAMNRYRLQCEVGRILNPQGERIVFYDSPHHFSLVKKLKERLSIYLALDDRTLTLEGNPIAGEVEAEKRLLAKVDKVICVSEVLAETIKSRMGIRPECPIHVLPNGYDERLFDPQRNWVEPLPLRNIARPRILVAGHVSERIDWDGILEAARLRPYWNWVFTGSADPGMPERIQRLGPTCQRPREGKGSSGFFWLGFLEREHLPALMTHCDTGAIPYRLNHFTRASSPLKAAEYLSMGTPVLSTRVPSLARYGEIIEWVEEGDGASYARALDLFEKQGETGKQERQKAVLGDTWQVRAEQLRALVGEKRK